MNVLASEFIETAFHHSYSVEQQNEFTLDVDLNLPAVLSVQKHNKNPRL